MLILPVGCFRDPAIVRLLRSSSRIFSALLLDLVGSGAFAPSRFCAFIRCSPWHTLSWSCLP